jgi:hypothetical protein
LFLTLLMKSTGSGENEARSSLSHSAAYQSRFMKLPSHTFNSGLMYASMLRLDVLYAVA